MVWWFIIKNKKYPSENRNLQVFHLFLTWTSFFPESLLEFVHRHIYLPLSYLEITGLNQEKYFTAWYFFSISKIFDFPYRSKNWFTSESCHPLTCPLGKAWVCSYLKSLQGSVEDNGKSSVNCCLFTIKTWSIFQEHIILEKGFQLHKAKMFDCEQSDIAQTCLFLALLINPRVPQKGQNPLLSFHLCPC